jgi:hypothetical protein
VAKRKVASAPSGTDTLTLGLSPTLRDSIKLLSASRKATRKAGKPAFVLGIVDDAILNLAALTKAGKEVAFIPVPRSSEGRTSLRVSARGHEIAVRASEDADVKLADFVRTALSAYVRDHANEIHQETKTSAHRRRKPARGKV